MESVIDDARRAIKPDFDQDRATSLSAKVRDSVTRYPEMEELYDLLLSFAGRFVVPVGIEEDLEEILERGRLFGPTDNLVAGERGQCHRNSARLWKDLTQDLPDNQGTSLVTGYALSPDGLWRQHTWIWTGEETVESTVPRILYFGYPMSRQEAERFCFFNP